MSLIIIVAKTQVVVFHGPVFHESGGLGPMWGQLGCVGQSAIPRLKANHGMLGCTACMPILLRLLSTLFAPAICHVGKHLEVRQGLHASQRSATSKLCTFHQWFMHIVSTP